MEKILLNKKRIMLCLLFYLIILTWMILFKCNFLFDKIAVANIKKTDIFIRFIKYLLPFKSLIEIIKANDVWQMIIMFANIILFIPIGYFYSHIYKKEKTLIYILCLTCFYEFTQLVFGIGIFDITDIIFNFLGGYLGISICKFFKINNLYKNKLFYNLNFILYPFSLYTIVKSIIFFSH